MSERFLALATLAEAAAEEAARALSGTLPCDFQSMSLGLDKVLVEEQQPQQSTPPQVVSFVAQPKHSDAKDTLKLRFCQMDFSTDMTTGDTAARPVKWMLYENNTPNALGVQQSTFSPTYSVSRLKEKKASTTRRRARTPDIFRPVKLGNYSEKRAAGVADKFDSYRLIIGSHDDPGRDAHRAARSGTKNAHRPPHARSRSEDSTLRHLTAPEVERIRRRSRIPWIDIVCHPEDASAPMSSDIPSRRSLTI